MKLLPIIATIISLMLIFSACSDNSKYVHKSSEYAPWLGVKVRDISERRLNNLNLDYGVEVVKVYNNSPAEDAGIEVENILLTFNGDPIYESEELADLVCESDIDENVEVRYLRDGEEIESKIKLIGKENSSVKRYYAWHAPKKHFNYRSFHHNTDRVWLGVQTDELTPQLRKFFSVPEDVGILIKEVVEDSPAEKADLQAGDVIIKFGRREIENFYDLIKAVDNYDPDEEVDVVIIRNGEEKTVTVKLGEKKTHYRYNYGFKPDLFDLRLPDMEFDFPEIKIEIPEFDERKIEELNERIREELEENREKLNDELDDLKEKLEEIEIKFHKKRTTVI